METEFGLLGDVEVRIEGQPINVGHARQRCVLAVLLVNVKQAVSVDQLVDRVWGHRAPQRARETLYNYLSRLRQALVPIAGADLARQFGGYILTVDPMAVDLHRFSRLVFQSRAVDDEERVLVLLEQALELWRGEPFSGLDTPWVNAMRNTLERDRFAVVLDRTDLQLRRGMHGWLLSEITARAGEHPLDERVAGQLMLALYRCGRQAEALEHFQQVRARLAEKRGIDPGPGLLRLYEKILVTDPALTAPTPTRLTLACATPPVPRQLPVHTPHFVGRAAELDHLTALLETTASGGTAVITAIDGTAGIGKTSLALHWAHRAAERFPDGQLYVNLCGFGPSGTPVHPADALHGFLDALGHPTEKIPTSLDSQAALYRSLLTDRRVLIVLDNARDAEQVRPLLPASPSCLVLITSRNQLTGLVTQEGACAITLDLLSRQEAHALLVRRLGPDRISVEPNAVNEVIDHCARLPLGLAIVAARASTGPGFTFRLLAKELADEHARLDALDTGDPATSVRTVFSWSYQHLSRPAAKLFRLLGLHPGPDIGIFAASQLADTPPSSAREAMEELTRAHLLIQHVAGRYTFHDLLRAYAAQLATGHDHHDDRHAALTRLFDHYLQSTAAAMDTVHPIAAPRRRDIAPAKLAPTVTDPSSAQSWLDTEQANLTAIIAYTAGHGWHTHTTRLANTVFLRYLEVGGRYCDALEVYTHVRHAACHTNDRATEALALTNHGLAYWQHGDSQQAAEHHQQAIDLCRETGFRSGEAIALTHLGVVHWQQGRYQQATGLHQHALKLFRDIGDRAGEARALNNLGLVQLRQGYGQQAAGHNQRALEFCQEIGFRGGEALALTILGMVDCQHGDYRQAEIHNQRALNICRDVGCRVREVGALSNLGLASWQQGHYQQATDYHQHALKICRDIGFPVGEVFALTGLGIVGCQQGHYQQAIGYHQHALRICRMIGDRAGEAVVLNGLAETYHASGQAEHARAEHAAALKLAEDIEDHYEQARARHGLSCAHHTVGDPAGRVHDLV